MAKFASRCPRCVNELKLGYPIDLKVDDDKHISNIWKHLNDNPWLAEYTLILTIPGDHRLTFNILLLSAVVDSDASFGYWHAWWPSFQKVILLSEQLKTSSQYYDENMACPKRSYGTVYIYCSFWNSFQPFFSASVVFPFLIITSRSEYRKFS